MKCKFCGDKMSFSDNLCTGCGRPKSRPLEPKPDYSDRQKGKHQDFFTMGKNLFYRIIFVPLSLAAAITAALIILPIHGKTQTALICADIILALLTILGFVCASKCYITVYKNCIEGRIPAKIPYFTKHFTVYYDDIIKIRMHGVGISSGTTRHSSDSHPAFVIITDFGAIDIKGLNDSQAATIYAHYRANREK